MANVTCIEWWQLRASFYPLPPRYGHSAASFFNGTTDLVYVYGGRGENATVFGDVVLFNPDTGSCEFELTDGSTPAARGFQAAIIAGHRYVVYGGLTETIGTSENEYNALTNSFYLLDILRRPMNWANRMQVLMRAPVYRKGTLWPVGWGRGLIPIQKQAIAITTLGQRILYFGGDIGNAVYSRCVFSYSFPESTWSLLYPSVPGATCAETGPIDSASVAPAGRAAAAAAPFSDNGAVYFGGSRIVASGSSVNIMLFDDLWLFSVATQGWQMVSVPGSTNEKPSPRDGHTLTVAPSWLSESPGWVLYGGRACPENRSLCHPQDLILLDDFWLLRLEGNNYAQWTRLRPCNHSGGTVKPPARSFHTMTQVNDQKLVLIGGLGGESVLGDVWSVQWANTPLDAPANPVQSLPLETRRESYVYMVLYLPKLSWYAPEQFTETMDTTLRQAFRNVFVNAFLESQNIALLQTASGGGGHGKVLARGTLAQYAVLIGKAFSRKLMATVQKEALPRYLSSQIGTPVEILAQAEGQPLPMVVTSVKSQAVSHASPSLSTAIIATIATVTSTAVTAFLLGVWILFLRRRWRKRRIQRIQMSSRTPGRVENGQMEFNE